MSYYFRYNFISPDGIFSTIQEEFKSYFDTGAIDNLLFNTYLDKCLRKLGRATYLITEDTLYIEDFQAILPDNFFAIREAWLCTEVNSLPSQTANSFYSQTLSNTIQVSPLTIGGNSCNNPSCHNDNCDGNCLPDILQAVYKTNHQSTRSFKREYLLKPGNISAKSHCDVNYTNQWDNASIHSFTPGASTYDSFDIRDNKFVTNFRNGIVYLIFYATEYDTIGNQMIPDNYRIKEYIEAFIKYKMMETLNNQISDETFQQLQQKLLYYKQLSEEAYILALSEIKSQDVFTKQQRIKSQMHTLDRYELPNRISRYGWRRN